MTGKQLQQHMIEWHGWPEKVVLEGRWVDFMDTTKGRKPIPIGQLEAKHGFDHSATNKYTAFKPHTHRS